MPGGFLSGLAPLCFTTVGDFSRMVSYPTWHHRASSRQETFCEWFPVRHGSIAFHTGRKLFANGFPSGMVPLCFIPTGNFSTGDFSTPLRSARNDRTAWCRCVSAWCHCVSYRQETFCEWFPIRHSSIAFHNGRKLFANGFPSGMAPLRFITTGNYSQMVSHPA